MDMESREERAGEKHPLRPQSGQPRKKRAAFIAAALGGAVLLTAAAIAGGRLLGGVSVGIIGGADGPTAIYVARHASPHFAVLGGALIAAILVWMCVKLIRK